MTTEDAPALEKLWLEARTGTLAPWSEAKAWALREVWKAMNKGSTHGLNTFGGWKGRGRGRASEGASTGQALGKLGGFRGKRAFWTCGGHSICGVLWHGPRTEVPSL